MVLRILGRFVLSATNWLSPPNVNVVNIGKDYEIGRSIRRCVRCFVFVCVCTCTLSRHISITVPDRRTVTM